MEKIIIELPEDLRFIKGISKIDWNILLGNIIKSEIERIKRVQEIVNNSQINESDIVELSDKINGAISERY